MGKAAESVHTVTSTTGAAMKVCVVSHNHHDELHVKPPATYADAACWCRI